GGGRARGSAEPVSVLSAGGALGLAGATICALVLAEPDWAGMRQRVAQRAARVLAVERAREDLAQAGMPWLSVEAWIALRVGASLVAALIAYLAFGVLVLGVVAS